MISSPARQPSPRCDQGDERQNASVVNATSVTSAMRRAPTPDRDYFPRVNVKDIMFGEVIGAGSFGQVWKGNYYGIAVAIKKCKVDAESEREELMKEIHHLEKLRHPRLVSYLGSCIDARHIYMILEFMAGGSLYALLFPGHGRMKKKLTLLQRVTMGEQVASGLVYLHDLNVVHRDLKTMNIILDDKLNCKICDFGLTVTLERTHLTVRHLTGSPRYMAPEQFEQTSRITEKVDIWAMGCVLLELLCDTQPFVSASGIQQIITELLVKKKAPALPAEVDPRARVLIKACFFFEPKQRPTAESLQEGLQHMKEDLD